MASRVLLRRRAAGKTIFLTILFLLGAWWPVNVFLDFDTVANRDFGSFWTSGHAIRLGIDPYDVKAFKALGDRLLGEANYNYTYPPHALFLLLPLSYLPALPAFIMWNTATAALLWWAARPWMPKGMPAFLALLVPGALVNYNYGQTGVLYSALFLLSFRGSGVAAALLTIKPQLGILILPAMMQNWRAFIVATIATFALVGASILVFNNWPEFFVHARDVMGGNLTSLKDTLWMIKGTTPAIGYGMWGWAPYALGAAYLLSRNYNVFTAATAAFLISPYGLHYDMAAVCLGFVVLLFSRWDDLPVVDKIAASLAFLSPVIVPYATTWVIPPILLWGLLIQTKWTEGIRLNLRPDAKGHRGIRFELLPALSK